MDEMAAPEDLTDLELEAAIGSVAARVAALQCRFLLLAAEVDRRRLWARWGMQSAAAWLSWRCGLDAVTAREHLRVGRALAELPAVRAAFAEGRLSYSKVRSLTRAVTVADEAAWVAAAVDMPASQLETLTRAYRKVVDSGQLPRDTYVRWSWDDDGSLMLSARLSPEHGALLLAALEQSRDALRHATRAAGAADRAGRPALQAVDSAEASGPLGVDSAEASGLPVVDSAEASAAVPSPQPTAVDALALVAATTLAAGPRVTASPARYQVVLHLAADRQHLAHGPGVADATVQRLACDAVVTALVHGDDRRVRSVGRRRRCVPPLLRRALDERDRGACRHPGCASRRYLEAHHVVPWLDGGPTELSNLVLLCTFHHDTLHSGGFSIEALGKEQFVFRDAEGMPIADAPTLADLPASPLRHKLFTEPDPVPGLIAGTWDGDRLDLDWAVAVLAGNHAARLQRAAA